ncbi:MAG: cytochrome C peroxidase [Candidatus Dadabacteria bacterium]|nr:MAG: cytochrome C peroxidase [Candidatus Dadabacteria bacterium]
MPRAIAVLLSTVALLFVSAVPATPAQANPCNPCAGKKMSNPCNPCNPCAAKKGPDIDPDRIEQPRRPKMVKGDWKRGEKLWNNRSLGKSGLACATCHINKYGQMRPTFAKPYPHFVQMAKDRAGLDEVNAAEMVQLCMVVPMMSDPLPWNSQELADLTAWVEHIQPGFKPANPCAMKHMKGHNPCNPCGMKKMNPCNPCGMQHKKMHNPCNPCGR